MSMEEMIEVLEDPDRMLEWRGTPADPELREQVREWGFGIFSRWETDRQVDYLLAVGAEEAADILSMALEADKDYLLSLLPATFRADIGTLITVSTV